MPRITGSSHGESRLRMLRIVRRGDRHDPKDLTVSCRFESAADASLDEPAGATVPGEALKNLVHATARERRPTARSSRSRSPSASACSTTFPQITRVRVEVAEQVWSRLEIGGKAQGQAFEAGGAERRTTAVTSNGRQIAVVSGIEDLLLLRTAGLAPRRRGSRTTAAGCRTACSGCWSARSARGGPTAAPTSRSVRIARASAP